MFVSVISLAIFFSVYLPITHKMGAYAWLKLAHMARRLGVEHVVLTQRCRDLGGLLRLGCVLKAASTLRVLGLSTLRRRVGATASGV